MKLKGRTTLVICVLALGAFAVFDHYRDQSGSEKTMEASRLMTVNFDQVDDVQIEKDGHKIHLHRGVDGWQMIEPWQDNADNTAVDDLVKNSFTEKIIDIAKEGADIDWKLYGLDKPLGKIQYQTTDGKKNLYEISALLNFENNAFARRDGENRVLVINSIWQTRASKQAMEFRDRRFLRHKIAAVDEVQLKNQKGLLRLVRKDGQWSLPQHADLKLDQNKVRGFLTNLADAKAAEILDGPQQIPGGKSLLSLNLIMDGKRWNAEVTQSPDKKIYARVSDPAFAFKMEPGALDTLISMTAEDFKETPPAKAELEKVNTPGKEQ